MNEWMDACMHWWMFVSDKIIITNSHLPNRAKLIFAMRSIPVHNTSLDISDWSTRRVLVSDKLRFVSLLKKAAESNVDKLCWDYCLEYHMYVIWTQMVILVLQWDLFLLFSCFQLQHQNFLFILNLSVPVSLFFFLFCKDILTNRYLW